MPTQPMLSLDWIRCTGAELLLAGGAREQCIASERADGVRTRECLSKSDDVL